MISSSLLFLQKQSEELASAAREQVEAVNSGTNVSVSKDQFDSTVTILNIVCSDVFPCVFESQLCHSHLSRFSFDVHWSPAGGYLVSSASVYKIIIHSRTFVSKY